MTAQKPTALGVWASWGPSEAASLLRGASFPWWIAGGWAIDLFVGRQTRPRGDLDMQVLRRDLDAIRELLGDWDFRVAKDGSLRPWTEGTLPPDQFCLWCRSDRDGLWMLELLVADTSDDLWIFRRDPSITRPIADVGLSTSDGIPYLVPEIQLLFKAKAPRPEDEQDFEITLPLLHKDEGGG